MSQKRDGSVKLTDRSSEAIRATMKPLTRKERIDQTDQFLERMKLNRKRKKA